MFVYDAQKDNVHQITFDVAQKLTVDISPKSPDGYVLERGQNNNGIFEIFGGGNYNYNSWYLRNGLANKRVYLTSLDNNYYYNNYSQFLGWVISGDIGVK